MTHYYDTDTYDTDDLSNIALLFKDIVNRKARKYLLIVNAKQWDSFRLPYVAIKRIQRIEIYIILDNYLSI